VTVMALRHFVTASQRWNRPRRWEYSDDNPRIFCESRERDLEISRDISTLFSRIFFRSGDQSADVGALLCRP